MEKQPLRNGLEGVIVAETRMSRVDGEAGELILGGYDVHYLAENHTFEDVCGLLWTKALPDASLRATIAQAMGNGRERAFELLPALGDALSHDQAMDALRAAMSHWRPGDSADPIQNGGEIAGAMAVFAAAWWRQAQGEKPVAPDRATSLAADYLRMLHGEAPDPATTRALDRYLITVADHGMNASTFAARVVTSTGSDRVSAIVAALGALKGPLHGGAPGPVLDMLDAIGTPERAGAWIDGELAQGRRIMGMGHRVYRVRDPRAATLERAAQELGDVRSRLALARAVESCAQERLEARRPDRTLRANVEFYTAVLLDAVGIERGLFTPTFAIARSAGWCGHIAEQRATGRLIRPKARYVGPIVRNQ